MGGITARLVALAEGVETRIKADLLTAVLLHMSYEHHKAHDGELFTFFFHKAAVAAGATAEVWFKTPASRAVPHLVLSVDGSAGVLVELIRDSTKTYVGGNILVQANHNDNYPDVGGLVQACHTPAGSETSVDIRDSFRSGGFKTPSTRAEGAEHICAPATNYHVRVTADGNGTDVNIKGTWYNKEDKVMPYTITTTTTTTTTTT